MRAQAVGRAALRLLVAVALLCGGLAVAAPDAIAATPRTAPAASAPRCTLPDGQRLTFTSGSVTREYVIETPPGGASTLSPLMLALHPLGWDLDIMRFLSRFGPEAGGPAIGDTPAGPALPTGDDAAAASVRAAAVDTQVAEADLRLGDREGVITVFPQALGNVWDLRPDGADTQFLGELVTFLHASGCSQPDRTMVSGFSMGAMMTARLICAHPDLFSGAAMVGGIYPPTPGCSLPATTSVVGIHGMADPVVHFDGSLSPDLPKYGIEPFALDRGAMMQQWAAVKGCGHPVASAWFVTSATEYTGCATSTVHMLAVYGGGHSYDLGGLSSSEYIWAVLRPADRSPIHSAATALHRSVGTVGATLRRPITAGSTLSIDTGVAGGTVLGTLTVTGAEDAGHLRAFPCDEPLPGASVLNYQPGSTIANGTAVHTGSDGRICIYTSSTAHILWDQVSSSDLPSHTPVRQLDTRGGAPVAAGATVSVQTGIPDGTVLGTVTAVGASGPGHVRLFACDAGLPTTSVLNFNPGPALSAGAAVHTGADGRICLYVSAATHLLWDQSSESDLPSHQASRILDTRRTVDGARRIPAGSTIGIDTGVAGGTVLGTLTAVSAATAGHLRVFPCDEPRPDSSALSVALWLNRATGVASRTSADGRICVYAAATAYVVWDQVAETALPSHSPTRLLDTRA